MTRKIPNLIIVAGDGRNSGKTTMCCRIIRESVAYGVTAVKISQHIHEPTEGLDLLFKNEGFAIYAESNKGTGKDSSAMLRDGAGKVYYIQVADESAAPAFEKVMSYIPAGDPVVCESPYLIRHFEPGVFIIMVSPDGKGRKDISEMKKHVHVEFTLTRLHETISLPFKWTGHEWSFS